MFLFLQYISVLIDSLRMPQDDIILKCYSCVTKMSNKIVKIKIVKMSIDFSFQLCYDYNARSGTNKNQPPTRARLVVFHFKQKRRVILFTNEKTVKTKSKPLRPL